MNSPLTAEQPINKYPDEPHPDNEWAWKSWWVAKLFKLDQPLYAGDLDFIHRCWLETKARWYGVTDRA